MSEKGRQFNCKLKYDSEDRSSKHVTEHFHWLEEEAMSQKTKSETNTQYESNELSVDN